MPNSFGGKLTTGPHDATLWYVFCFLHILPVSVDDEPLYMAYEYPNFILLKESCMAGNSTM